MLARRRLGAAAVAVGLSLAACSSSSEPGPVAVEGEHDAAASATTQPVLEGADPSPTARPAEDAAAPSPVAADPADGTPSSDDASAPVVGDGSPTSQPPSTIVPEVPAPELVPEPVSDSFLVDRVVIPTGSGGIIDVHRPIDGDDWPLVVLYGDLDVPTATYAPLATALAESGAVVAVSAFDADQPPVASACALSAATIWAEENRADPSRLTVVGIGAGAVAATGEALGGAWTSWSTASCTAGAPPIEPSALVTIDGSFGLYDDDDPTSEGLRAIDQLEGGNPYLRIGVVQGEPVDAAGQELVDRLATNGYDASVSELTAPASDLLLDPEPLVQAIRASMEIGTAA